jgi:hypothetical protein
MVVPAEEPAAVSTGVLDVVEALRELGPVLQGLEVRLGVGVVAGGIGPPVVMEQERGSGSNGAGSCGGAIVLVARIGASS